MKHRVVVAIAAALLFGGAASLAQAQTAYKVPFAFQSGTMKPAAGLYVVSSIQDGKITLRREESGKEYAIPFTQKLTPTEGAPAEPRLVFDEVGDFAPSYTEYVTVYILAEVWTSATEGYLIHTTKGAHKTKIVKAEAAK